MQQPGWCLIPPEQLPVPFQHFYCKDLKALFRPYLDTVKSYQGRRKAYSCPWITEDCTSCSAGKNGKNIPDPSVKVLDCICVLCHTVKQRQSSPLSVGSGIERSS